ncbi:glycosyltransferase [Actinotalea solisilvae]|uniref:glycosyltransferase n=1 Tax=Actinotalea solisilvae TaxID=2072922 RepID=UPI0018F25E70|nr:glycosyltransferase [Actinotalea solisilvae]
MTEQRRTVVLDDHFPVLSSGFRVAEFTELLRADLVTSVRTTVGPLDELVAAFGERYPDLADRVHAYDPTALADVDQAYLIFLNNAAYYLDDLTAAGVPFVLTLYPGGGLDGTDEALAKLDRVLGSPLLRHLFTTQPRVAEMVAARYPHVPTSELQGLFVSRAYFRPGPGERTNYFGVDKETLDLCFVAHRYSVTGADKGFPEFAALVPELARRGLPVRGHVVGQFDASDLPPGHQHLFEMYGVLESARLQELYGGMDAIVSPNRPGVLAVGAFDGFPLASSVEAALCGVMVVATDEFRQSRFLRDGRDALVVVPDAGQIADRLVRLLREPGGIRRVAQSGLRKVRHVYAPARQLDVRAPVLRGDLG